MFVETIANRQAKADHATPLSDALLLLKDYPALMLTDGDAIVGGISRGGLFRTFADYWLTEGPPSREVLEQPVRNFVKAVPVVPQGAPVEEAADLLVADNPPLVAVTDRRGLPYGVISWVEVNRYLREITGMDDKDSVRFSLALIDMPGQLARVAEVVGRAGANITALTLSDPKVLNWVHLSLRVDRAHADIARAALDRAGIDIIAENTRR